MVRSAQQLFGRGVVWCVCRYSDLELHFRHGLAVYNYLRSGTFEDELFQPFDRDFNLKVFCSVVNMHLPYQGPGQSEGVCCCKMLLLVGQSVLPKCT